MTGVAVDNYVVLSCDSDVQVGCFIMYSYNAAEGCSYAAYDASNKCLCECIFDPVSNGTTHGGGFGVDARMSYIKFSNNASLSKTVDLTVSELIDGIHDPAALYERLELYQVDEQYWQDIVNLYLDNSTGGTSYLEMYPIGSIYLASIDSDPSKLFGGNWKPLYGVFHESVYAWTRIDDDNDDSTAIADLAVADLAICAEIQTDDDSVAIAGLAVANLAICA